MSILQSCISTINKEWHPYIQPSLFDLLEDTLNKVVASKKQGLCPDKPDKILKCLSINPNDVKVVIVGQDVYPQPGIATGYAFACEGKPQPSLEIMMRELQKQYGECEDFDTTLKHWVDQGVLLLNVGLSCEVWEPRSHVELWKPFVKEFLKVLNDFKITRESMTSLVFVGLGGIAKEMIEESVNPNLHHIIYKYHPAAEKHGSLVFEGFYKEVNELLDGQIKW